MTYDTATRLPMENQTYESDFCAIVQMLGQKCLINTGLYQLERCADTTWIVTDGQGERHSHLLREYAIHHLLYCYYMRPAC